VTVDVDVDERVARAGFAEFVRGRGPALHRTAYLLTGDWALAEDLLQTALAKSYLRWDRVAAAGGARCRTTRCRAVGDDRWDAVDARTALRAALDRLPRRMRAVVVLRFHEDMTEAAVAAALGISVGTVRSQAAKALAKLRADDGLTGYAREESA
jgi:DNA-directed RNA polymerase specialized sigma24 family protein